jgi:hypothetical protein
MSKEMLGKSINIENVTKEKLIEAVKASKNIVHPSNPQIIDRTSTSIENHVCELIEKMESAIPTYAKASADLLKKYLHLTINFYNGYYFNQKGFTDKIGVNEEIFKMIDTYMDSIKKVSLLQMDGSENMVKKYVEYRLDVLNFYEQMTSNNIEGFRKMMEMINSFKNIQ